MALPPIVAREAEALVGSASPGGQARVAYVTQSMQYMRAIQT